MSHPLQLAEKIFGTVIMVLGIGMVALPAGILASAFSEQMRLRRQEYEELAEEALEDGLITQQEQQQLAAARTSLGLSEEDAEKIFEHIAKEEIRKKGTCPHCNKALYNRRSDDAS